jgi:dihydrofolate synthase/folylpolyglutamate synthase
MLGNSIEEIAKVKCGIITNQSDVVTISGNSAVMNIIEKESYRKKANLHIANYNDVKDIELNNQSNTFVYKEERYKLRQNGEYQINNAIIAIEVIRVLSNKGYCITKENLYTGLSMTHIKGRFDVVDIKYNDNQCTMVVDGAHNEHGMESLIKSLNRYFPEGKRVYILSVFKDKNYKRMFELVGRDAWKVVLFNNNNVRSLKKEIIKDELCLDGKSVNDIYMCNGMGEAVDKAISIAYGSNCIIVCAGSLSFMKDLYERLNYNG